MPEHRFVPFFSARVAERDQQFSDLLPSRTDATRLFQMICYAHAMFMLGSSLAVFHSTCGSGCSF